MKKLLTAIFATLALCASAQEEVLTDTVTVDSVAVPQLTIAVYSHEKCWAAMPELQQIKAEMEILRGQYAAELRRAEADFKAKYEDFLEDQAKLATSIRNKRQAELQKIMEENLAFKAKAHETLDNTERERLQPLKELLQQSIETVAQEGGYSIVINLDGDNCPYFSPTLVSDITEDIITKITTPVDTEEE